MRHRPFFERVFLVKLRPSVLAPCVVLSGLSPAYASGFALEAQAAKAIGGALAGAQAERGAPGFSTFNPAAIVGVDGLAISASAIGLIVDSGFENSSGQLLGAFPVGGEAAGDGVTEDAFIPSLSMAAPLNDRLFVGLSVNAPFGLATSYGETSIPRYHALETELTTLSVTPVLGLKLNERISLAAGPRIQRLDFLASGANDAAGIAAALGAVGFTPGTDDSTFRVEGDDMAVGFVAGAQVAVSDRLDVGFSFTSKITHDFEGEGTFDNDGSVAAQTVAAVAGTLQDSPFQTEIVTPASFQLGAQIEMTPELTLLASTVFTRWSSFETVTIDFENPVQPNEVLTQDWRDTWAFSGGVDWRATPRDSFRAGVMFEETPVNDFFASPRIPDSDRLWLTAGYSRKLSETFTLHTSAAYIRLDDRPIAFTGGLPENQFRGAFSTDFQSSAVILSVGLDVTL